MLLQFTAANYKSFKDAFTFSMIPAPKQKGLDYSVMQESIDRKKYKALCSSVIYGPNASGKTNIISAMDTFKAIVLKGHVRNSVNNENSPNVAAGSLELIPNNRGNETQPVTFAISFIEQGLHIEYEFTADLGAFIEVGYEREILSESLKVNTKMIFSRDKERGLKFETLDVIRVFLVNAFDENAEGAIMLAKSNLNREELFLTNGFKAMFSSQLVTLIANWLDKKLITICRADLMRLVRKIQESNSNSLFRDDRLNELARYFGVNSNDLVYKVDKESNVAELYSFIKHRRNAATIPAEIYESYGTIRFMSIIPFVIKVIVEGGTLVIDEFDASIHPMALMNIVNLFHNDEINVNHAQLIFNTHNPIFLNANIFRRDEIKFVERDDDTHISTLYSLSDFGTAGETGVRKNEDYMKNYFIDRYGAIKDVNFAPFFEALLQDRKEV